MSCACVTRTSSTSTRTSTAARTVARRKHPPYEYLPSSGVCWQWSRGFQGKHWHADAVRPFERPSFHESLPRQLRRRLPGSVACPSHQDHKQEPSASSKGQREASEGYINSRISLLRPCEVACFSSINHSERWRTANTAPSPFSNHARTDFQQCGPLSSRQEKASCPPR